MKTKLSILLFSLFGLITFAVQGQTVSTFVSSGLNKPAGLATDAAGNIYVADEQGNQVLKYTPDGVKSVVASPVGGYMLPNGVAVDANNNIYVSTNHFNQHTVFKVTPANVVTEVVPDLMEGPVGLAVDAGNNLYVADLNGNTVRKVTPTGVASIFTDQVDFPVALTVDGNGNIYILSGQDSNVYKFNAAGTLSTSFSGLSYPSGIAVDANNNVFVADTYGHRIVKITSAGVVSNYTGIEGIADHVDGPLEDAYFTEPFGITIDANDQIYISEFSPNRIRKITFGTLPVTLVSYTAKTKDIYISLAWKTLNEQNNKLFEIYRSGDDKNFVKIGELPAANNVYSFNDRKPLQGNNYYKLIQVDNDGKQTELGIRNVTFDLKGQTKIYPNPTRDKATIVFEAAKYHSLSLSSLDGRELMVQRLSSSQIDATVDLSRYAKGIYLIKLIGEGVSTVQKAVKQ